PEPLHGALDHALDVGDAGDVGYDRDGLRTLAGTFGGDAFRARRALVGDDESRALVGEQQRGRPADAGAAAGDDADLVREPHGHSWFRTQRRIWRATVPSSPSWFTAVISASDCRLCGSTSTMV